MNNGRAVTSSPVRELHKERKTEMARLHFNNTETDKITLREVYLFDNYLSFRSKGLLSMLYMINMDCDFSNKDLANTSKDTAGSVKSSFRELETLGYVTRKMLRDENGRFTTMEYTVHDRPKQRSIGGDIHCW